MASTFQEIFSNCKRKFIYRIREVEEVSCRRNGLRKQVTEAKEGPSELGGEREVRVMCLDLNGQSTNSRYYSLESDSPGFKFRLC